MDDSNIAAGEWLKYHEAIKQHGLDNITGDACHEPHLGHKPYMEDSFFVGFNAGYHFSRTLTSRIIFAFDGAEYQPALYKIRIQTLKRFKIKDKFDASKIAWKTYHKAIKNYGLDNINNSAWHQGKSHVPYMCDAFYAGFFRGRDAGLAFYEKLMIVCWDKNEELAKSLESVFVEKYNNFFVDNEEENR